MNMGNSTILSRRIYLADDDLDDHDIFRMALNEVCKECELFSVYNGEQLLQNLKAHPADSPDIIFLDLNIPGKGGMETLRNLRGNPYTASLPVVIYSTSADVSHASIVQSLGANLYFVKPNDFVKLKNTLLKILSINWSVFESSAPLKEFMIC